MTINSLNGLNTLKNTSINQVKNAGQKEQIEKASIKKVKLDEVKLNPKNEVENKQNLKTSGEANNRKNILKNQIAEKSDFSVAIQGNNITPNKVLNLL